MQQLSHINVLPFLGRVLIESEVLKKQMCHGSLAPPGRCGLNPGFVGSQLLDGSQTQWSSAVSWEWYRSLSRTVSHEDR